MNETEPTPAEKREDRICCLIMIIVLLFLAFLGWLFTHLSLNGD